MLFKLILFELDRITIRVFNAALYQDSNSSALIKLEELYTNWSTCSVVRVYENTIKESESEQEFITCGDGEERKETSSSISVAILRLLPTLLCSARLCGRRRLLPQISHC